MQSRQKTAGSVRELGKVLLPPPALDVGIRYVRPLLYRGSGVTCPCCGTSFRRFLTHRRVPNVRCPRCGSMERHRLLWLWLAQNRKFLTDVRKVLHMAPEPPITRLFKSQPGLQYVTADLASPLAGVHCDIQDLPFRDGFFDLIVCNHVLEHIPDDRRAMSELYRVLSPGCRAIVMCPIARGATTTFEDPSVTTPQARLAAYGQEDHARLYGSDYVARLEQTGFTVMIDRFLDALPPRDVGRFGLRRSHDLFEPDDIYIATVPQ